MLCDLSQPQKVSMGQTFVSLQMLVKGLFDRDEALITGIGAIQALFLALKMSQRLHTQGTTREERCSCSKRCCTVTVLLLARPDAGKFCTCH